MRVAGHAIRKMELRRKRKAVRDDVEGEGEMRSQQARAKAQKIGHGGRAVQDSRVDIFM